MCVSNLLKSKKSYYENLDSKNITDNKKFCGIVKPHSLNKVRSNTYIAFNEGEILLKHEYEIFNLFFIEIVPNLGTKVDERYLCNANNISDPIEKGIQKCKTHTSISIIIGIYCRNKKYVFFLAYYCR